MTLLQKICLGYTVALLIAASINYIPGLTDDDGLAFGIFALDLFDDALHVASALWALAAALYLGDGVFGFFTGYGFLDFGIFTNPSAGMSWTLPRLFANLPHLALGGFALWAGLKLDRR